MTGNEIRKQFLEYFKRHNHQIVRSSSLVPYDDPTLLFTNAGMVQFKRIFLSEEKRNYIRAATSQKCVRAGGKHNDLENVGYTARHHTFFEMLGNFSFGDYFKEKAIELAWDLLTNVYKLPKDKLWVSVYLDDDEAYNLWVKNIGLQEDRLVRFGEKDNFWSMGDTGPCGPCSEILIDRGEKYGCNRPECKVGCECDRYLEIWNLVFMQFDRDASGKLIALPKPSIDTGMGLERIVSVLQNVPTNYDTDLILPIMQKVESLSEKRIGALPESDVAMKVISDHSRAATFLIGDGVLPSNEGRGYVLRRIMRRAIRYGRNIGLVKPFLHSTTQVVIDIMKSAYPEISNAEDFILSVIKNEEERFSETLDKGLGLLMDTLEDMKVKGINNVPGSMIFKLYDTYGFPLDIVKDVVRDENISLDLDGFDMAMQKQKSQSRASAAFSGLSRAYSKLSAIEIKTRFVGYDQISCDSKVLALINDDDGTEIQKACEKQSVKIIVEKTPFYSESGGQVGDKGIISGVSDNNGQKSVFEIKVLDTIKDSTGIIIHKCRIISGNIKKGQEVTLTVDKLWRSSVSCNHTATHILHYALSSILGNHVRQAGSLVTSDRLRFDFSHFSRIEPEDLDKIETLVNEHIRENETVMIDEMDAGEALKSGATALFEEKYGDRVKVVSIGSFSKELCGGIHAKRTGNIGFFKIIGETGIAAGVRRIEALTGERALVHVQKISRLLDETSLLIKEKPESVAQRVEKMLAIQKNMAKEIEKLKTKVATVSADDSQNHIKVVNGIKVFAKKVSVETPAMLRDLADNFKDKIDSGVIVFGSSVKSKVFLVVIVTKDLSYKYNAGKIIKKVAKIVGGGGGGRPDMAQAGGTKPEKLNQALDSVYEIIGNMSD